MALEAIEVSGLVAAPPERVYAAWLDAKQHGEMTGGGGATVNPTVGGEHTAWDGYIRGVNVALEPPRRIVQTWRSTEFPESAQDSRLEVVFEPVGNATRVTIRHSDIPEGQGEMYQSGWQDHYLTPMAEYFGEQEQAADREQQAVTREVARPAKAAAKPKRKAPTRRKVAKAKPARRAAKRTKRKPARKPAARTAKRRKASPKKKERRSPKPRATRRKR